MKRKILCTAIGGVLLAPVMAMAQSTPSNEQAPGNQQAVTLDELTVTARRRTESIQDVPVAVSAFGEEQLNDLQASTVEGLQGAVPNMNIVQGRGSANSVNVSIRGIGQPDALQTFDPGVGMYVDDVYFSRINGALFSLYDIQQLEVLRGPQGTLYGKNSTGGAIKLTTKNPFDNEGGSVEVTAGDYGRLEGRFYVGQAERYRRCQRGRCQGHQRRLCREPGRWRRFQRRRHRSTAPEDGLLAQRQLPCRVHR